jgi:hypothetical protein
LFSPFSRNHGLAALPWRSVAPPAAVAPPRPPSPPGLLPTPAPPLPPRQPQGLLHQLLGGDTAPLIDDLHRHPDRYPEHTQQALAALAAGERVDPALLDEAVMHFASTPLPPPPKPRPVRRQVEEDEPAGIDLAKLPAHWWKLDP